MLFIPEELITYFALKYDGNGLGVNFLEEYNTLNSLRAVLLYSEISSAIDSNLVRTEATITIDPDDPNARETKDIIMNELLESQRLSIPDSISSHGDLTAWLRKASTSIKYEQVPGLPDTKISYADIINQKETSSYKEVNDKLRTQVLMGIFGDPSIMDSENNVDYASIEEDKRILTGKKLRKWQDIISGSMTAHLKKLLTNDMNIRKIIFDIIEPNLKEFKGSLDIPEGLSKEAEVDYFSDEFINIIELVLPTPIRDNFDNKLERLENYINGLEVTIEHHVSEELISDEVDGDASEHVENLKMSLIAHFVRQWMTNENFMPELSDLLTLEENGINIDIGEELTEHKKGVTATLISYLKNSTQLKKDTDIPELDEEEEEEDYGLPNEDEGDGTDNVDGVGDTYEPDGEEEEEEDKPEKDEEVKPEEDEPDEEEVNQNPFN